MRSNHSRRERHDVSYFVLPTAEDEVEEIARITRRGFVAFFDPATNTWINDPLLGAEIHASDEWRPAARHELPPGVTQPEEPAEEPGAMTWLGRRKQRRGRRRARGA